MPLDCASLSNLTPMIPQLFVCSNSMMSANTQWHKNFIFQKSKACLVIFFTCCVFVFFLKCFLPDFHSWTQCWFFYRVQSLDFEVFLQVLAKKTRNHITRVTWQCIPTSLVTCRRSGFRKLFFYVRQQNCIKSHPSHTLLARSESHLAAIGQTANMSVLVRTKHPPFSLDSFVCNWYPRRKKCYSVLFLTVYGRQIYSAVQWKGEFVIRPQVSDQSTSFALRFEFSEVAVSFSRCPVTQSSRFYTLSNQWFNS